MKYKRSLSKTAALGSALWILCNSAQAVADQKATPATDSDVASQPTGPGYVGTNDLKIEGGGGATLESNGKAGATLQLDMSMAVPLTGTPDDSGSGGMVFNPGVHLRMDSTPAGVGNLSVGDTQVRGNLIAAWRAQAMDGVSHFTQAGKDGLAPGQTAELTSTVDCGSMVSAQADGTFGLAAPGGNGNDPSYRACGVILSARAADIDEALKLVKRKDGDTDADYAERVAAAKKKAYAELQKSFHDKVEIYDIKKPAASTGSVTLGQVGAVYRNNTFTSFHQAGVTIDGLTLSGHIAVMAGRAMNIDFLGEIAPAELLLGPTKYAGADDPSAGSAVAYNPHVRAGFGIQIGDIARLGRGGRFRRHLRQQRRVCCELVQHRRARQDLQLSRVPQMDIRCRASR